MSDYNVGQIIGFLKLNKEDFSAGVREAKTESAELDHLDPTIKVTVKSADAIAQLVTLKTAENALTDANIRVQKAETNLNNARTAFFPNAKKIADLEAVAAKAHRDEDIAAGKLALTTQRITLARQQAADAAAKESESSQKSAATFNLLFTSIALIGPAIVPIAAAALGAAGALGGMGAAGLLAFKGIGTAMTQGTALGQTYIAQVGILKTSLTTLEQTAASGFLTPISNAVAQIQAQMPQLNAEVGQFSAMAGHVGGNIFTAILSSIHAGMPLFIQFGVYLDQLSAKFAAWTGGSGFQRFIAYAQGALPGVENLLTGLITLIDHVVVGLAPMGSVAVSSIGILVQVLNSLPIGVLQVLVPMLVAGKLAFDGWKSAETAAASLMKWSTAASASSGFTSNFATAASIGSKAIGALGVAGLVAGPIIGALAGYLGQQSEAQKQATQNVNDYTAALIASNGVVNESIYNSIAKKLLDDGALSSAQQLGVAQRELTGSVAGNAQAWQNTKDQLQPVIDAYKSLPPLTDKSTVADRNNVQAQGERAQAAQTLLDKLGAQRAEFEKSQTAQRLVAASANQLATSWAILSDQSAVTASSINAVTSALGLTSQQGNGYAAMLGITADMLKNGEVSNAQYATAVYQVQRAYSGATATGDAYLKSLATFASSAGTAADRAALIGATLVASQGDMLSYTGAMAAGIDATNQMSISFQQNTKDVVLGIKAYRDTEKAAISYTTTQGKVTAASIDYTQTGAVPLVQQLEAIQSAAKLAAQATYQHEAATGNLTKASDDAITVFDSMTNGALTKNAAKLGLTADQASALAKEYFNISDKDLKSTVEAIGLSDIADVLGKIGEQLAYLTGHPFTVQIGFALNNDVGKLVHDAVNNIDPNVVVGAHAFGGTLTPGGLNLVGENGPELIDSRTNMVYTAGQTAHMLARTHPVPLASAPTMTNGSNPGKMQPQIIVNPSAGMDERAVGTAAGRHLMAAMV